MKMNSKRGSARDLLKSFSKDTRGQLTLFVIVAIIIVVGIVGYFAVSRGAFDGSSSKFPEFNSLVEECLEEVTLDGIYFNSLQGGYYDAPEPKIEIDFLEVPIYFDRGSVVNVPSKEILEGELEKAIQEVVDLCFDVEDLRERGYDVEVSDSSKVKVRLSNNYVDVEVEKNVVVSQGETSASFSKFNKRVGFDYLGKHKALLSILEIQKQEPSDWITSRLGNLPVEEGFIFELYEIDEQESIYTLLYEDEINKEDLYSFNFVVRFL